MWAVSSWSFWPKILELFSAPFSQPHVPIFITPLHYTHFSSAVTQENSNLFILMLTVFSSSRFHITQEKQEMLPRHKCPWERVNSVARFCCIFFEGEGSRDRVEILFKANLLQQVYKSANRRGWVLSMSSVALP